MGKALLKKISPLIIYVIPVLYYLIFLYLRTVRLVVIGEKELLDHLDSGRKAIIALWHQRLFCALRYARIISPYRPSAIISQSRDGDLIARIAELFNIRPIRGSSSRGGKEALKAIVADLAVHRLAIHALDGPRGPRWYIKPGLVVMAKLSQAAIYPVYISVHRAWALNSWDRLLIPKPFSRMIIFCDRPFTVHRDPLRDVESMRLEIEQHMRQRQEKLDQLWQNNRGEELNL